MRISLVTLHTQLAGLGGLEGVDSRALTGDEAVDWIRAVGEFVQSANAISAVLTARVSELSSGKDRTTRFARAKGYSDVASLVAEVGQVSRGAAGQLVTLGAAMADADAGSDVPLTVGAVPLELADEDDAGGNLPGGHDPIRVPLPLYAYLSQQTGTKGFGMDKAAVIRATLVKMSGATPEIEKSLVDRAKTRPTDRVRVMCREEWERVDHDGYLAHLRSLRKDRFVKFWDTDEGMVGIYGKLDPISALPLRQWVEDTATKGLRGQRNVHESERLDRGQLAADALTDLAVHRLGCQSGPKSAQTTVVVHAAADDVVRGEGAMFCHGYAGPLCLELLSQVAFGLEVAPAVTGKGGLALFLGASTRFFTPAQKRAIALRDQGCAKCGAPVTCCDVHHIQFWSNDGPTDIDNGVLLCSGCHHRLHDFGWIIEIIADEVWFVPPASVDPKRRRIPACATRSPAPAR